MDYLFMIELNNQTTDLVALKNTIAGFVGPASFPYLEVDNPSLTLGRGIVGIARFEEKVPSDDFFDKIRNEVARINGLDLVKAATGVLQASDIPAGPATWARATMEDSLNGFEWFEWLGGPDPNYDKNLYFIKPVLKGGIGGKH